MTLSLPKGWALYKSADNNKYAIGLPTNEDSSSRLVIPVRLANKDAGDDHISIRNDPKEHSQYSKVDQNDLDYLA